MNPDLHRRPQRRALLGAAAAALALPPGAPVRAQPERLRVALVPYLSARVMLSVYEPLRQHFTQQLGREVEFHTAPSFRALAEGARTGDSLFTLMPMHLARIAVDDWGHALVARSTRQSPVQLLVPRARGLKRAQDLRGQRIAAIDPLSITSLMLQRWLATEHLDGTIEVVNVPSANAAALALSRGEVAGMVVAQGQALDVPGLRPDDLEPLAQVGLTLTPCFVAHPRVPPDERAAFRRAVLSFVTPGAASVPAGASGAQFVEGSPRDLEPYEPYAALARRMLAQPRR
ncbi:MAG: PhnD/SsuA/transferrin family substrate-binding protein [Burkholderiales bacterium]|nr:PhnD/SsuA/transferrin family substrate-binding protein [Burkholderiales bacterium]